MTVARLSIPDRLRRHLRSRPVQATGTLSAAAVSMVRMPAAKTPNSATILIVSLRWNGEPLATRAVKPGETVVLGDARSALAPLPEQALGAPALVVADAEGG